MADPRRDKDLPPTREAIWRRLEELLTRAQRDDLSSLNPREIEELGRCYRATATHLSLLRGQGAPNVRVDELNRLVARAHGALYGRAAPRSGRRALWLNVLLFPRTIRRSLPYHGIATLVLILGGLYGYFGAGQDPEWALEFIAPNDNRTPYADTEELRDSLLQGRPGHEREIGLEGKTAFAAFLWQNNVRVALMAFFSGFLLGVPTLIMLLFNGILLGVYTRIFHDHDLSYEWWAWILPHGITEIGAICLLGGGGLWIGRMMLAPGLYTRADRLRQLRGDLTRLLFFAFVMLFIAAGFESFVRQSGLSEPARYAFAAATAVLWTVYLALVDAPASTVRKAAADRTLAERLVPLPEDEELTELLSGR